MSNVKHPNQPVIRTAGKRARFKQNDIVRYLLDNGSVDLDKLAEIPFDDDDRNQLAQLIGYSVVGFGELDYADPERVEWARQAGQLALEREEKEGDKENIKIDETVEILLGIISRAREANQDGARFKAEVESRINDQVSVTYRLEVEVSK